MTGEGTRRRPDERVLRLAAYLRTRPGPLTRDQIVADVPGYPDSDNAETVRKALQRDLRTLRDEWGIGTTWDETAQAYRLDPPFLTGPERAALVAAAAAVAIEGAGPTTPGELGTGADDARTRVMLRVHELVPRLRSAIAERRRIRFGYAGRPRTVEPWRVALWHDRWYVEGHDVDAAAPRWFRLDRIEREPDDLTVGEPGAFERPPADRVEGPPDLDPNAWGPDPAVTARVLVDADHVGPFLTELGGRVAGTDDGDTAEAGETPAAVVVELTVRHRASVRDRLLRFGTHARVLEPPDLAADVTDWLAGIAGDR